MNVNKVRVRLGDMLLAIERLERIIAGVEFATFQSSFEKQWLVDRGEKTYLKLAATCPTSCVPRILQCHGKTSGLSATDCAMNTVKSIRLSCGLLRPNICRS